MTERIFNFSAGPSMLPVPVLERAAAEMLNYNGSGMSVMEMSHRSKVYDSIIKSTEASLRRVMGIPDNYKVLFLQGGATMQFSAIPLNLLRTGKADYAVTGNFANNAYKEAKKFGDIHVAATSEPDNFTYIPSQAELDLRPDADYFYICANNTIFGTEWKYDPETGDVPVVADMSSNILSKPVDVSKYGVIMAGAQKNMGPAGLTVVIVRDDLLGFYPKDKMPVLLDWKLMADKESMYNTPPTYAIYILGLVLDWIEHEVGGLVEMEKQNAVKAKLLYDYLDSQSFYQPAARADSRSRMNVTFRTGDEALDAKFVKESIEAGMSNLKGHRLVGGMRASIYNAMPYAGVEKLVGFMEKFAKDNK
ncbi:MAG: 3-phosphoserine/phosphohydroxythreonine transaminase [Butyricicoccus sp.]|nr:3-phosphoserine/phosphohydroxythreonine transaminase [Clostridiales bacterium]MDY5971348.1 3-phosphoserine/phosphohydroxythreonine transaminase [Butyricicoccus sp.]